MNLELCSRTERYRKRGPHVVPNLSKFPTFPISTVSHEFPPFPLQWIKITLLLEVVDLLEYGKKYPGFRIQIDRFSQKKTRFDTWFNVLQIYRSIYFFIFLSSSPSLLGIPHFTLAPCNACNIATSSCATGFTSARLRRLARKRQALLGPIMRETVWMPWDDGRRAIEEHRDFWVFGFLENRG